MNFRIVLPSVFLMSIALVAGEEGRPLKALLVAGGCCHDYAAQHKLLFEGIQARAFVQVDVWWTDDKSTNPPLSLYDRADWATGYDVIIHDECAAGNKDLKAFQRIVEVHRTIPSVHLHCAMHSFRNGTDGWFKHLGLQSSSHGPQEPIDIDFVDPTHPVTKSLSDWTTIKEELYNNVQILGAHPLATGTQRVKNKDGSSKEVVSVVVWTNETQGARSFSTSLGHNNGTVGDPRYLDLVTRGLLWACGKLDADHLGKAFTGPNKITFVKGNPPPAKPAPAALVPGAAPKDATLVMATASSEESGKNNVSWCAVDGNEATRWCASGASYPQWLQLELEKPHLLSGVNTAWENKAVYQYKIEGSTDGSAWTTLVDGSGNTRTAPYADRLATPVAVRFVRIQALGSSGGWASIREVTLTGEGIKVLHPKLNEAQAATARKLAEAAADPYAKEGNVPPRAEKPSAAQEAAILADVHVAEGFDVTVFAAPPMVNYPVFVAAAPDGTVYVSSDGNGSLGRDPKRGRIIRLRDLDGDGRADETKVFAEVDAPRGLVWDKDRLYVMHPPHLSAFLDKDVDGVSESREILVKNLAFGYDKRPADHTTNGVSLGPDGWLYLAGGDFGFMEAEGTDGRKLTHRGGGVIRVRPDGTGLEMVSTGTRNILEVAVSPELEIFARDNTNDGGGWNVRFHHFTGLDDHGYPRLYKNFADEAIAPLADYGGGSGCGAVYLDEPGFGAWNHAPLTCDWGTGALYHHSVQAKGATFVETSAPKPLVKLTRPTDADVDAMSRIYCASWKGATFKWEGPDVGYIVCVKPKGFVPEALPDFAKAEDSVLVKLLDSPSYRRRIESQRELARRGHPAAGEALQRIAQNRTAERNLIARFKEIADAGDMGAVDEILAQAGNPDPVVAHAAARALAALQASGPVFAAFDKATGTTTVFVRALALMHRPEVVTGLIDRLQATTDPTKRQGLLAALCRLHFHDGAWQGDSWGTRPDTRGPFYQPEPWSETPRIAAALAAALEKASPAETGFLVREMNRNRIQSNQALERILELAKTDPAVIPDAAAQLAVAEEVPASAVSLLLQALEAGASLKPETVGHVIVALSKTDSATGAAASLKALADLRKMPDAQKAYEAAAQAFFNAPSLENHHQLFEEIAETMDGDRSRSADAALLHLAVRQTGSPESAELSRKALDRGWADLARRRQIIEAIGAVKHQGSASRVLVALEDADPQVRAAAQRVAKEMRLVRAEDKTPKIGSLKVEEALAAVIQAKGDVALGEQVFNRATCSACHTTNESQAQKGPYLGNIAQTYKRADLAQNILDPNQTIAQGFASEMITLKDGSQQVGFVTLESAGSVKIRNVAAQEFTFQTAQIKERQRLPVSMMPPGLMLSFSVREFASLLDYLESLAK
jgi:putative membrane-bound dehydrogenase-like protein